MKFNDLIDDANQEVTNNNYNTAIDLFNKALKIEPQNEKILYNIGVCYLHQEKYYMAIDYLKKALTFNTDYFNANNNLAIAYKKVGEYQKALSHLLKLYKVHTNEIELLYNIANTLSSLEEYQKAYIFYEKVLKLDAKNYKAFYGIGLIYNYLLNFSKAEMYFKKSLSLKPNYPDAFFALSLVQLRNKDYKNGWINYESRWDASNPLKHLKYPIAFYNGQSLENRVILIQEEQGFGDNIQLIRYLEHIKLKKPKKIYVAIRKPLEKLFDKIEGIQVVGDKEVIYNIDFVLSLHSAPRIFQTTYENVPNQVPYLPYVNEPLTKELKEILSTKKLKIGFAHLGNPDQKNSYYKSINLELLSPLFELSNIEFYSLQIDPQAKNKSSIIKQFNNLHDLSPYIEDFFDTANIFNHLDMIITIDSALSHLAGAYAKKTILLAPKNHDWRWVNDNGISPWYPSVQVIVQKELGIWGEVVDQVKKLLASL